MATKIKSYAINFTCKHQDDSISNSFRAYDYPEEMSAGQCYNQALDYIKEDDETITKAIITNMVGIQ